VGLLVLAATGVGLVLLTAATARRPTGPLPSLNGYFVRWQEQHRAPDVDPGQLLFVRQVLTVAYGLARPLARLGCRPDALTLWGMWLAGAALVAADGGGRWVIVSAALVLVSAMSDAVDGAVAALTDRATGYGFVLDSVADRLSDVAFVLALLTAGGEPEAAAAAAVALFVLEYTRARAGGAGHGEVGVITVGERPTRVAVTVLSLLAAGVHPASRRFFAGAGLWATTAVCVVGLAQLAVDLRRRLR
jgi:CDP-diacylglycerol--glycerol-3-phosphate 3-phosphatidyltransferase